MKTIKFLGGTIRVYEANRAEIVSKLSNGMNVIWHDGVMLQPYCGFDIFKKEPNSENVPTYFVPQLPKWFYIIKEAYQEIDKLIN